jgi:phage-related baseplate assembly protein
MEADEDLRQRIVLAPESFSVAGPELAYVFHARSAHPDVLDASATSARRLARFT